MTRLILAWLVYEWHLRVKKCPDAQALVFMGRYTRLACYSCGKIFWQADGLFSKK